MWAGKLGSAPAAKDSEMLAVDLLAVAEGGRSAGPLKDNRLAAVAPEAGHAGSVLGMASMEDKQN